MSEGGIWELHVSARFMDDLFNIEQYIGRLDRALGRAFSAQLLDFAQDILGTQPLAFPGYRLPRHPEWQLRRAVYRKRCVLLYEITGQRIELLAIFGTGQDVADIQL